MVTKGDSAAGSSQSVNTKDLKGKVITQDGVIIFEKVPIVTPNNDVLVEELSFKVTKGTDVIIAGPNGNNLSLT
jgi:ATP-binding cassette subfamily D (ALD) protein 3